MKPLNQMTTADLIALVKGLDKKLLIKIGAGSGVGLLALVFVIWPAWITRLEVRQQVNEIKNQVTTTQNLLRRKPQLLQDKDKYIKFSQEVKGRMFQPGEASLLLGIVSKMAQESKVSIVSSTPKTFEGKFPPPFDVQYEAGAYDFTVEGGYHDFGDFVNKLENYSKVLRVQTFHIMPQDKEKAGATQLARLSLTAVAAKRGKPA